MKRNIFVVLLLSLFFLSLTAIEFSAESFASMDAKTGDAQKLQLHEAYGNLPLYFIQNNGQVNEME